MAERRYWTHLANAVFEDVRTGVARLDEIRRALDGVHSFDDNQRLHAEMLAVKQGLIRQRDVVLHRLDLWAQSLRRMYSQGQTSGQSNQMLRWRSHPGKEHCRTCAAADGQVHRASSWAARQLYPGSPVLECVGSANGVPVCGCGLEATTERAQGRIDRIPVSGMKSLVPECDPPDRSVDDALPGEDEQDSPDRSPEDPSMDVGRVPPEGGDPSAVPAGGESLTPPCETLAQDRSEEDAHV